MRDWSNHSTMIWPAVFTLFFTTPLFCSSAPRMWLPTANSSGPASSVTSDNATHAVTWS